MIKAPAKESLNVTSMANAVSRVRRRNIFTCLTWVFLLWTTSLFAHSPHDHIEVLGVPPDYATHGKFFVVVRGMLLVRQPENDSRPWQRVTTGLANRRPFTAMTFAGDLSSGSAFLSSDGDGVYRSIDEGKTWSLDNRGLTTRRILDMFTSKQSLFAISREKGAFRTMLADSKANWTSVLAGSAVRCGSATESRVYLGDRQGRVHRSNDDGDTWSMTELDPADPVTALTVSDSSSVVYAGCQSGALWRSDDQGETFKRLNSTPGKSTVASLALQPGTRNGVDVLAIFGEEGAYRSIDSGESWTAESDGLTTHDQADLEDVPNFDNVERVSLDDAASEIQFLAGFDGLFQRSGSSGIWEELSTLPLEMVLTLAVSPNFAQDQTVLVGTYWRGVFLSDDAGDSWRPISKGLGTVNASGQLARIHSLEFSPQFASDRTLFAGIRGTLFRSMNAGEKWKGTALDEFNGGESIFPDRVAPSPSFAKDRVVFVAGRIGRGSTRRCGVLKSVDGGRTFTRILDQAGKYVHSMALSPAFAKDQTLFVAIGNVADRSKLMRSMDGGKSWTEVGQQLSTDREGQIIELSPDFQNDHTIWVGSDTGLSKSSDRGETWMAVTSRLKGDQTPFVETLACSDGDPMTLIVGSKGSGMMATRNVGATFAPMPSTTPPFTKVWYYSPPDVLQFAAGAPNTLFGITGLRAFRSTDGGTTWKPLPLTETARTAQLPRERSGWIPIAALTAAALLVSAGILILRRKKRRN